MLPSFCFADENDKIDLLVFCGVTQFEFGLGKSGIFGTVFSNTPVCSNTVLSQFTMNLLRNVFEGPGRAASASMSIVSSAMETCIISSAVGNGNSDNAGLRFDEEPGGVSICS